MDVTIIGGIDHGDGRPLAYEAEVGGRRYRCFNAVPDDSDLYERTWMDRTGAFADPRVALALEEALSLWITAQLDEATRAALWDSP